MINGLPNPPVLPSPRAISDPDTRGWAQSLTNSLQTFLGQVSQAIGGASTGIVFATPDGQHTYLVSINNAGNALVFTKLT